ncbi:TetR/AcrR family transcriptional regulator [Spirillospora sp. CA-294931]|uniref:TetR/AcrR family transcriptional regulator n=1 Tax=Spirillospora sp. CA-294931 TaxID=3240042 RepID=UPI003D8EDE23
MPRVARHTPEAWAAAALDALAEGGVTAVAVEPVAARLGTSKSSFYWLFENREALLTAALELWERRETDELLPRLAAVPDPAERLRALVHEAFGTGRNAVALRLLFDSDAPSVHAIAKRVTNRRIAVIETALRELGQAPEQARHLATAGYAVYLGTAALHRVDAAPLDERAYVDAVLKSFGVTRCGT